MGVASPSSPPRPRSLGLERGRMEQSLRFRFFTIVPEEVDTASTCVWRGMCTQTDH